MVTNQVQLRSAAVAGVFALLLAVTLLASKPNSPCSGVEHRQFDFWLGVWDVSEKGKVVGRNTIALAANGCALHESWQGNGGFRGMSLNFFDAATSQWQQHWIGSDSQSFVLRGGLTTDGAMRLEGEMPTGGAAVLRQRITWTRIADGQVRQLWERETSPGGEWTVLFDGDYRRAADVAVY